MAHRKLRRMAVGAACATAMAGAGLVTTGATAALAATTSTAYTCTLTGVATQTQAGALNLTTPDGATPGSTVTVNITQPGGTAAPVAITSVTVSGTATVAGDGSTTSLPFTGTVGPIASGATIPDVSMNESLTMPAASGTVTVTLPTTYNLSIDLGSLGTEAGTCTSNAAPTANNITVASQPTVTISSISGQSGTSDARPGATVNFSGTNFSPGATVGVSLVPNGGGTAIPVTTSPATLTADSTGAITGSATIPSSVTPGAYALTFSDTSGDLPAALPLTILGSPSCTASPNSGGAGTVAQVSCTNFDPGAAVTVQGYNSSQQPTSDPAVSATADSSGAVSASYTVNDSTTAAIAVIETGNTSIYAYAPFAASANSCIADQNGSTGGSCSTTQGSTTTVNPGPLEMAQAASQIQFSNITLNGTPQTVSGNLNQVTVADYRGSTLGWTLNATATGFTGSTGGTVPASSLTVTPACVPDPTALAAAGGSFPSTATAGPSASMGSAVTLCSEPASANGSVTGGVFDVTGALSLSLPAYLLAGNYINTITFSLG